MVNFAKIVMPSESEVLDIFIILNVGPTTAQDLIKNFPDQRKNFVLRSLVWLTKIGFLKLV
jgi:hypothetical protein